jgi:hypothetical protein
MRVARCGNLFILRGLLLILSFESCCSEQFRRGTRFGRAGSDVCVAEWVGGVSVSASQLDTVTAYVQGQREHHKKMTFEEEFVRGWRRPECRSMRSMCLGDGGI